jgi:hypothetical protein
VVGGKRSVGAQGGFEPRIPTPLRGFIRGGRFPGVWLHVATLVRPHPRLRHLPPLSGLTGRLSSLVEFRPLLAAHRHKIVDVCNILTSGFLRLRLRRPLFWAKSQTRGRNFVRDIYARRVDVGSMSRTKILNQAPVRW